MAISGKIPGLTGDVRYDTVTSGKRHIVYRRREKNRPGRVFRRCLEAAGEGRTARKRDESSCSRGLRRMEETGVSICPPGLKPGGRVSRISL